ncbi:MAG: hypothetical protein ROZ09_05735 [Thiobacillus sp.]|uniref:ORC-CDC6 family AAA ATPase n=1 Tax=Thiobacillus sp. TaxID=924 RepID=UPI00289541F8|nr:hypothetical protein [Thiobacillus sp.]MDT3706308.1 hypothetical protein [Thiobacillus sp.]
MSKYCCFFCPSGDYSEKRLEDPCPSCGRPYGFVLKQHPKRIADYTVTRELGRGFYGAAYVAESGPFNKKFVLKISPVSFYTFFGKPSFEHETELHNRLAEGAEHIVGIVNRFDEDVVFSDADQTKIACHVTVLDFVNGDLLRDYTDGKLPANSATICQIAIDLLRLRAEFEANELNHNDLHAENLIVEKLPAQARRKDAIDDSIRVKAIDLGSLADASKSTIDRHGDLYFIATHVDKLLSILLSTPTALDDRDFRTALALQSIVHGLLTDVQNARHPNPSDLINEIKESYYRASQPWHPWSDKLSLKSFADHYNAQTLVSSDVPSLLVDPQNRWLEEVSKPGPQIITGMRGCGKTMLLRALDFHAQASHRVGETDESVLERIEQSQVVGLFVSAQRLLDLRHSVTRLEQRLTRLYVHYALQAARALLHLRDLDREALAPGAHVTLANGIADYLNGADDLRGATSVDDLESRLEKIAVLSSRGNSVYTVKQAPVEVFQHLAERFRMCSRVVASSTVLFLLDDVSTRYLELERVEELLSALLFQSPVCAFKFTSEWQTIELGLRSPGRNHPIREGRDLSVFDLGADVLQTINASGKDKGNDFVAQILQQRAKFHASHPKWNPKDLLGDVPLEQVAREIASSNATSKERKQAYRGLSCLTSVCVGDIGDVIKLYEEIIKRASAGRSSLSIPIEEGIQAECFLAISSRRLYDLNRRGGFFKSHALAFAEAARDLLGRSYREGVKLKAKAPRLRQYSSLYVRVTSDNQESQKQQIDLLRELIDAGVFVYSGGAPRTKTKDSDPVQQFKLSFRKIYGLASYIGLADRDRFELSGPDLAQWLEHPNKEILLRNQIASEVTAHAGLPDAAASEAKPTPQLLRTTVKAEEIQQSLFDGGTAIELGRSSSQHITIAKPIDVCIRELDASKLQEIMVGGVITGLGFEDRTLASNKLLANALKSGIVHAVRYDLAGHADEITNVWRNAGRVVEELPYRKAVIGLPRIEGLAVIDISGLSKPLIFAAIRRELQEKGRVLVCHVTAQYHYPLQEDLEALFAAEQEDSPLRFLESLANVLKGEQGPYKDIRLVEEEVDLSRNRALLAFASAKHERLFSLLDRREFDYVEVIAPDDDTPRARVANYAAEFLCQNHQNSKVTRIPQGDLVQLVSYLDNQYLELYGSGGANVELGLTGSKIQAVAAAVLSARRKVAQAWYLAPTKFDEDRFSTGVATSRIFDIFVPGSHFVD